MSEQENENATGSDADLGVFDRTTLDSLGVFNIDDDITPATASRFNNFMHKSNFLFVPEQELNVIVSTAGGCVYSGLSIIDHIKNSRRPVSTHITGIAASMGALIASSGTKGKRTISENAFVMCHVLSSRLTGTVHEMSVQHKHTIQLHKLMFNLLKKNTELSDRQVKKLLGDYDAYLTPQEALKYNLVDKICGPFDAYEQETTE